MPSVYVKKRAGAAPGCVIVGWGWFAVRDLQLTSAVIWFCKAPGADIPFCFTEADCTLREILSAPGAGLDVGEKQLFLRSSRAFQPSPISDPVFVYAPQPALSLGQRTNN